MIITNVMIYCCMVVVLMSECHGRLNYDFGKRFGMQSNDNSLNPSSIQQIQEGIAQGKRESIYLMGLMKFYGHGAEKDEDKAISYFKQAAALDYDEAKFTLAVLSYNGQVIPRNDAATFAWLTDCTNGREDNADAFWILGTMYNEGRGVSQDIEKAVSLFKKSSDLGNPNGDFQLGIMYEYGRGNTAQDFASAAKFYSRAADEGLPEAQYYLGLMVASGRGFPQDFTRALTLFTKASDAEYGPAMSMLGKMYTYGQGVPIDYSVAAMWFDRASNSGDAMVEKEAAQYRDELASLLSKVQENMINNGFVDLSEPASVM